MKSTPEGLNNKFEVNIIARKSKKVRSHKINLKNVRILEIFFLFYLAFLEQQKRIIPVLSCFNFSIYYVSLYTIIFV